MATVSEGRAFYYDQATSQAVQSDSTQPFISAQNPMVSQHNDATHTRIQEPQQQRQQHRDSQVTLTRNGSAANASSNEKNMSSTDSDKDEDLEKQDSKKGKEKEKKEDDDEKDPNIVEWDGPDDPVCISCVIQFSMSNLVRKTHIIFHRGANGE